MKPNSFIIYVTDVKRSVAFYSDIFDMKAEIIKDQYASFKMCSDVIFALWSGKADSVKLFRPPRGEVGLMIPGPAKKVDELFAIWQEKGAVTVEEPHDEMFGRTFVVADPDGNLIRVALISK